MEENKEIEPAPSKDMFAGNNYGNIVTVALIVGIASFLILSI